MKRYGLIILCAWWLVGCQLAFAGRAAPTEVVEPPPTPEALLVDLPTPTPGLDTPETNNSVVSLLDGAPPTPTLPAPAETGRADIVRLPRYNTSRYSFEPAAGWEVVTLGQDTLLIRLNGDEEVYDGVNHTSPYVYLHYSDQAEIGTPLTEVVAQMRGALAGVETAEEAAMPIIDGLRGIGQFVEGRNAQTEFRAYLAAFPLQGGVLQAVFWGSKNDWGTVAPPMGVVLQSLRWPRL